MAKKIVTKSFTKNEDFRSEVERIHSDNPAAVVLINKKSLDKITGSEIFVEATFWTEWYKLAVIKDNTTGKKNYFEKVADGSKIYFLSLV